MSVPARDHLYVSFAPEDWALAEWLTLRLTREGYRLWCSRFPVLGGERHPGLAEAAIRDGAFCVLALLSRAALSNPKTTSERSLALGLGRDRGREFLVALLTEAIDSTQLASAVPGLAPISFAERWETGVDHLLGKLRDLEAPRPLLDGERVAQEGRQFLASRRSWHTVL